MALFNTSLWNSTLWNGATGSGGAGTRPVTAGRLIYDAYRALGVLRPGQSTSPEGHDDALGVLNDLVDFWNTESLMVPSLRRDVYPLTAGVGSYTLGPGGTLGGERPQRVTSAALVACDCGCGCSGGACRNLRLTTAWQDCSCNSGISIDTAYPDVNIRIHPAPYAGESLALQSWQTLSGFADLDTPYGFAPGYALAMRWGLAQQLAPLALIMQKIPQPLLQVIEQRAIESKAAVKSLHSSLPPTMDASGDGMFRCCGGYSIYTDGY
jgi:hypothetical protein